MHGNNSLSRPTQAGSGSAVLSRTVVTSTSGFSLWTTGQTSWQRSRMPVCHSNTSSERWKLNILYSCFLTLFFKPQISETVLFWSAGGGQSGTFLFEWWRQTGHFLFLRRRRHCVERRNAGEEWQKVQVNHIYFLFFFYLLFLQSKLRAVLWRCDTHYLWLVVSNLLHSSASSSC